MTPASNYNESIVISNNSGYEEMNDFEEANNEKLKIIRCL